MDDVFSKIKRKLVKQEPEVISPSEREQRLRQMLGYDQSERKAIDPGFLQIFQIVVMMTSLVLKDLLI